MFCKYCGKQIKDGSKFCASCGAKVDEENQLNGTIEANETKEQPQKKVQGLGLAGFIVSVASLLFIDTPILLIGSIVGLILSAIALKKFNSERHKFKGFAIAGLVISITSVSLFLFAIIFLGFIMAIF